MNADAHLFDIRPAIAYINDRKLGQQVTGQQVFAGENAPRGTYISYHLRGAASGDVKITITDVAGRVVRNLDGTKDAGINRVLWNMAPNPPPGGAQGGRGGGGGGGFGGQQAVAPGTYTVTLTAGGTTLSKQVQVLEDRWMDEK
jgi:hypothetical protein